MEFLTVNYLRNILNEVVDKYGDLPVLLCIDPDQSYSKRILQPMLDVKLLRLTDKTGAHMQDAIGLMNIAIESDEE